MKVRVFVVLIKIEGKRCDPDLVKPGLGKACFVKMQKKCYFKVLGKLK
jgi:hypothetical protein